MASHLSTNVQFPGNLITTQIIIFSTTLSELGAILISATTTSTPRQEPTGTTAMSELRELTGYRGRGGGLIIKDRKPMSFDNKAVVDNQTIILKVHCSSSPFPFLIFVLRFPSAPLIHRGLTTQQINLSGIVKYVKCKSR